MLTNLLRIIHEGKHTFPDDKNYEEYTKLNQALEDELLNIDISETECLDINDASFGYNFEINESGKEFQNQLDLQFDIEEEEFNNTTDKYNITWLIRECNRISRNTGLDPDSLFDSVTNIILSEKDDSEIQNDLLELAGFEELEFLMELVSHRDDLIQIIIEKIGNNNNSDINANKKLNQLAKNKPQFGSQVNVMFESEKKHMKQLRKDAKKASRQNKDIKRIIHQLDSNQLRRLREDFIKQKPQNNSFKKSFNDSKVENYPNIYKASDSGQNSLSIYGTKFHLPVGTIREDGEYYDEIIIPIAAKAFIRNSERTIMLDEMDSLCKEAFKKYTSLNRVQSIVYPIAYKTNENMLLCAPTGAGKTDVAMLTILRTLYQHCTPTPDPYNLNELKVDKTAFKIVYVAPMKALATEVVHKMGSRLKFLGIQVRELTGDMQLSKEEILKTQMIVTTPEKWDVVTRKGTGDTELVQKLKLLIIDEVHLLHDDRGSVIESIVARTLRQVESTQSMIRIVGLSATLPNYVDVSKFLKVNPYKGLFYFDGGFRPVPLEQHFVGVRGKAGTSASNLNLDRACYEKVEALLSQGHQVMVFVHTRKETVRVAKTLIQMAAENNAKDLFEIKEENLEVYSKFSMEVMKSRNGQLKELFKSGVGAHHAGMLRNDRLLTERMFAEGALRLLCCTATLAWGVNLPAYAVVIRGTQVYDAQKGSFVDLSILDVLQIFGRAGRPQYESQGVGYIITTGDKLSHYVSAITQQHPIESNFVNNIVDNLCAEICLGTVTNIDEAVQWLSYTFLYIRMQRNPMIYGINYAEASKDPYLNNKRRELVLTAAKTLSKNYMITFDEQTGELAPRELGRISSLYYVSFNSMDVLCSKMKQRMGEADAFAMASHSMEFTNIKLRENEILELKQMNMELAACPLNDGFDTPQDKVNLLMQVYISKGYPEDFALVSDLYYISQNAGRIFRALLEVAINRKYAQPASVLLSLCKSFERQLWSFQHPLLQFNLPQNIQTKLDNLPSGNDIWELRKMSSKELGDLVNFERFGSTLFDCVERFPLLDILVNTMPLTDNILKIELNIFPDFEWNDKVHGKGETFWIFVEDINQLELLYSDRVTIRKSNYDQMIKLEFTLPIQEPLPELIYIRSISDRWLGSETLIEIELNEIRMPKTEPYHTKLLDISPLSLSALNNPLLEDLYSEQMSFFNPIQTHIFSAIYQTEKDVLLACPIGSGEDVMLELLILKGITSNPKQKVVYVNPSKHELNFKFRTWQRLARIFDKNIAMISETKSLADVDIILSTPEELWPIITKNKGLVSKTQLIVLDKIHRINDNNGHHYEVLITLLKSILSKVKNRPKLLSLSTTLTNALDMAEFLNIERCNLFNFTLSERPIPLQIEVLSFSAPQYQLRMASMNRPIYNLILNEAPFDSTLIITSSSKQSFLTAKDIMAYSGSGENPRRFLKVSEDEFDTIATRINDKNLKITLGFGIGIIYKGMDPRDLDLILEIYTSGLIQILIITYTLAKEKLPKAKLTIIKGTEYYSALSKTHLEYPYHDIMEMISHTGRPTIDHFGKAYILTSNKMLDTYLKIMRIPFPIESKMKWELKEIIGKLIEAKVVKNKEMMIKFLENTMWSQRAEINPDYYDWKDNTKESYFIDLIEKAIDELISINVIKNEGNDFWEWIRE